MSAVEHFLVFERGVPGKWIGKSPVRWCDNVGHTLTAIAKQLSRVGGHDRDELLRIASDPKIATLDLCTLVFAWGGMRVDHGRRLLRNTEWVRVAEAVRAGLDHIAAYEEFFKLSVDGKMPGCGPAYYTKLLYFLPSVGLRGIIMDQWTARSINLLYPDESKIALIRTSHGYRVSPRNDRSVYSQFVAVVRDLSERIGADIEETEKRLFCQGGKIKGAWRTYVIEHG